MTGSESTYGVWVHNACFSKKEQEIADYLTTLGRDVKPNPKEGVRGAGRQGDAIIDGIVTEFKSLDPGATSGTIKNVVNKSVKNEGQARSIVIDARGSGLSESEARRGLNRAWGANSQKLDDITIIGDNYSIVKK